MLAYNSFCNTASRSDSGVLLVGETGLGRCVIPSGKLLSLTSLLTNGATPSMAKTKWSQNARVKKYV